MGNKEAVNERLAIRNARLVSALTMDPNAIAWVANKYKDNPELSEAAELICKHAMQQATD